MFLAKVLFNICLILCTLLPYLVAKVGVCVTCCCVETGRPMLHKMFPPFLSIMWRLQFWLCSCWIRFDCDGLKEFQSAMSAKTGKPCVLIQNHTSFLDAFIALICMPISTTGRVRALASDHLFKMPVLGTIITAAGHLCVPFKTQATHAVDPKFKTQGSLADFSVDKDALEKVMEKFEEHLKKGGVGAWYPEGRMNPNPSALQTFRAGGFKVATKVDCEVWCLVCYGNDACWPRKETLGGNPCKIGVKMFKLCDSTFEYCKMANIDDSEDHKHQNLYIANSAQARMQNEYDLMRHKFKASDDECYQPLND